MSETKAEGGCPHEQVLIRMKYESYSNYWTEHGVILGNEEEGFPKLTGHVKATCLRCGEVAKKGDWTLLPLWAKKWYKKYERAWKKEYGDN